MPVATEKQFRQLTAASNAPGRMYPICDCASKDAEDELARVVAAIRDGRLHPEAVRRSRHH
jgi:hypothetical protein